MPYLSHTKQPASDPLKPFSKSPITDSAPELVPADAKRRTHFADEAHRKALILGPEDIIQTDFAYGFLTFYPSLALSLPGGISFDLVRYWDGQPVTFVCCERKKDGDGPGRMFWCVVFEIVLDGEEGEDDEEEKEQKSIEDNSGDID